MKQHKEISTDSLERGHELTDAWPRSLAIYAVVLIALLLAVMAIADQVLDGLNETADAKQGERHPLAAERQEPPAPQLQVTPLADIAEHRAIEERLLGSYEWVDREAGIVRIPVSRAMDLIVERKGELR